MRPEPRQEALRARDTPRGHAREKVERLVEETEAATQRQAVDVFSHDEQKSVSKIPGLGHIPIIGELFKNRGFDSNKRELVIFVTPRIVNPDSDKIRSIIDDVKSRYKQARAEVTFGVFD